MGLPEPSTSTAVVDSLRSILSGLAGDDLSHLPEDVRHELMRTAVVAFAEAWQQDRRAKPLNSALDITATEAVVTASALIRALNIELFELAMWQTQAGA
jgi:hypothetical protein